MRRFCSTLLFLCLAVLAMPALHADNYKLLSGQVLEGDPIGMQNDGVYIKPTGGNIPDARTPWTNFSQEALMQLYKQAKGDQKQLIEPYVQELAEEKVKQRQIDVKPVPRIDRPTAHTGFFAAFSSPVGLLLIVLVYAANIYAGYEVCVFRQMPAGVGCTVSAVVPFIGPVVLLCLKKLPASFYSTNVTTTAETTQIAELADATNQPEAAPAAAVSTAASTSVVTETAPAGSPLQPTAVSKLPDPIYYRRGEFSFNRRFFETKMPGFFRVVPSEKDKDLLLHVKCTRGDFVGRRISKITPAELELEVFKDAATASELIPFVEITEVQIRHKDLPLE